MERQEDHADQARIRAHLINQKIIPSLQIFKEDNYVVRPFVFTPHTAHPAYQAVVAMQTRTTVKEQRARSAGEVDTASHRFLPSSSLPSSVRCKTGQGDALHPSSMTHKGIVQFAEVPGISSHSSSQTNQEIPLDPSFPFPLGLTLTRLARRLRYDIGNRFYLYKNRGSSGFLRCIAQRMYSGGRRKTDQGE